MMGWGGWGTPALTVLSTSYYIKVRKCFPTPPKVRAKRDIEEALKEKIKEKKSKQ